MVSRLRFLASIGAGGVIYMTPMVFNQISFSATQVGNGLAAAALIGTLARVCVGYFLDKGIEYKWPIIITAIVSIFADLSLFRANNYNGYIQGQLLFGIAAGIYWPTVELAVPLNCRNFSSSKGYALARSSDALGISIGTLIGALSASINSLRLIYIVDILCMLFLIKLLRSSNLLNGFTIKYIPQKRDHIGTQEQDIEWLFLLTPIILISLVATTIFSLLQSALPLELVRGGLARPAIQESWSGIFVSIQLGLLLIIQWPIGNWLSNKKPSFGLTISLIAFGMGSLLMSLSSIWKEGIITILFAQIPLSIAIASFLPTATEAVIEATPIRKQGLALSFYSQCFAISSFCAPLIAGHFLDKNGHGINLWLLMTILSLLALPLLRFVKKRY